MSAVYFALEENTSSLQWCLDHRAPAILAKAVVALEEDDEACSAALLVLLALTEAAIARGHSARDLHLVLTNIMSDLSAELDGVSFLRPLPTQSSQRDNMGPTGCESFSDGDDKYGFVEAAAVLAGIAP
jgi:hypothetical protein